MSPSFTYIGDASALFPPSCGPLDHGFLSCMQPLTVVLPLPRSEIAISQLRCLSSYFGLPLCYPNLYADGSMFSSCSITIRFLTSSTFLQLFVYFWKRSLIHTIRSLYRFFTLPTASPDLRLYVSSEIYTCAVWPPSVIDRYQPPLLSLLHSHAAPYPRVSFGAMQFQRPVLLCYFIRTHNTLEDCQIYELSSSYSEFQQLY